MDFKKIMMFVAVVHNNNKQPLFMTSLRRTSRGFSIKQLGSCLSPGWRSRNWPLNSGTVKGQIRRIFAYRALSHGKNFTRKRRRRRSVNRCLLAALLLHDRVSHQTMGRESNYANDSLRLAPLPSLGSTHGRLAEIHNGFRLLGRHTAEDARCQERDDDDR